MDPRAPILIRPCRNALDTELKFKEYNMGGHNCEWPTSVRDFYQCSGDITEYVNLIAKRH